MMRKPQPITRAYRMDLADRREPFGSLDDAWLAIGSLLEHAAATVAEDESVASALVREASQRAVAVVDPARLEQLRAGDSQNVGPSPLDAIILLSDQAHDSGAPNVCASILDSVVAAEPGL